MLRVQRMGQLLMIMGLSGARMPPRRDSCFDECVLTAWPGRQKVLRSNNITQDIGICLYLFLAITEKIIDNNIMLSFLEDHDC